MADTKPLKETCGGYHTDSNFDVIHLSRPQVNKIARRRLKRDSYCNSWSVIDCGTHWAISLSTHPFNNKHKG